MIRPLEQSRRESQGMRVRHPGVGMWTRTTRLVFATSILAWFCHLKMCGLLRSVQMNRITETMQMPMGIKKKQYLVWDA